MFYFPFYVYFVTLIVQGNVVVQQQDSTQQSYINLIHMLSRLLISRLQQLIFKVQLENMI